MVSTTQKVNVVMKTICVSLSTNGGSVRLFSEAMLPREPCQCYVSIITTT